MAGPGEPSGLVVQEIAAFIAKRFAAGENTGPSPADSTGDSFIEDLADVVTDMTGLRVEESKEGVGYRFKHKR